MFDVGCRDGFGQSFCFDPRPDCFNRSGFLNHLQLKNLRKTKKNIFGPETKTSPKSLVFWFSRGFEQSIGLEFFCEHAYATLSQFAFADMSHTENRHQK